jgi:hypothetical protein
LDVMYSEIRRAVNGVEKTIDKIEMLVRAHFYSSCNRPPFHAPFPYRGVWSSDLNR